MAATEQGAIMVSPTRRLVAVPALLMAFGIVGAEWIVTRTATHGHGHEAMPAPARRPVSSAGGRASDPPRLDAPSLAQHGPTPVAVAQLVASPQRRWHVARRRVSSVAADRPVNIAWPSAVSLANLPDPRTVTISGLFATARALVPHGAFGFGPFHAP